MQPAMPFVNKGCPHITAWLAAGVSFLGLPPLPAVPLPYKDNSAQAPLTAESGAEAPAPAAATGAGVVKSFLSSFIDVRTWHIPLVHAYFSACQSILQTCTINCLSL